MIKIHISGPMASGKTTIAKGIATLLLEKNIRTVNDDGNVTGPAAIKALNPEVLITTSINAPEASLQAAINRAYGELEMAELCNAPEGKAHHAENARKMLKGYTTN